jgi:hypothetical protein
MSRNRSAAMARRTPCLDANSGFTPILLRQLFAAGVWRTSSPEKASIESMRASDRAQESVH